MQRIFPLIIVMISLLPGCQRDAAQVEIAGTLEEMVQALGAANWNGLWEASHPEAQEQVLGLHKRLSDALDAVDTLYPVSEQPIARAALGRDLVSGIEVGAVDSGPRLLSRLFASGAIRLDEKTRDGLTASSAAIDGDRAVINTTAGEVFTFGRANGAWKSRLLVDMLQQSRAITSLQESATAVEAALKAKADAWSSSQDPKQAQGAYNLARAALQATPFDGAVLYALLDDTSKATLVEAMAVARQAQTRLQRRSKKSQRDATYERHDLTMYVKADSDRALYEAWAQSAGFVSPLKDNSPPLRLEGGETASEATVITKSNTRINFTRSEDGSWRLADTNAALTRELLKPVQALLAKLSGTSPSP